MGNLTSYTQSYKIVVLYGTTTAYFVLFYIFQETIGNGILRLLIVFSRHHAYTITVYRGFSEIYASLIGLLEFEIIVSLGLCLIFFKNLSVQ